MRYFGGFLVIVSLALAGCSGPASQKVKPETATSDAEAVLDRYYEAVGKADFDGFIALFSKDSVFYGTDASEIWSYEEFAPAIKKSFETGVGWDFDLKDRRLSVSQDGQSAWFAELAHFNNTDYLLRPSGAMALHEGEWKIVQLVMGIPIPNDLYTPVLQGMQATSLGKDAETNKINAILDNLHELAAAANGDEYFNLFTEDAIYIGTDVSERWTIADFKAYALPFFNQGRGWRYTPRERHVVLSPMANMAWFDEVLDSENYGTSRGTGTLIRTREGWKISQYHLTFPIPNDLADEMTRKIIAFESANQ